MQLGGSAVLEVLAAAGDDDLFRLVVEGVVDADEVGVIGFAGGRLKVRLAHELAAVVRVGVSRLELVVLSGHHARAEAQFEARPVGEFLGDVGAARASVELVGDGREVVEGVPDGLCPAGAFVERLESPLGKVQAVGICGEEDGGDLPGAGRPLGGRYGWGRRRTVVVAEHLVGRTHGGKGLLVGGALLREGVNLEVLLGKLFVCLVEVVLEFHGILQERLFGIGDAAVGLLLGLQDGLPGLLHDSFCLGMFGRLDAIDLANLLDGGKAEIPGPVVGVGRQCPSKRAQEAVGANLVDALDLRWREVPVPEVVIWIVG